MTKPCSIVLALLLLNGCSWFGNDDDDCSGPGCDSAGILDNTPSPTTWYCYGSPNGTWDCQKKEDPSKIAPGQARNS